jgi:uncharacterized repeat protein (TIGR03803 family)
MTPAGVLTTLYSFTGLADGGDPVAGLTRGSDGNLYGTTYGGGNGIESSGNGTVFKITPAGVFTALHALSGADGYHPQGALTQGSDGNFYGTTYVGGGSANAGTIFMITPAGGLTTLYTFTGGADGSSPAGLGKGSDGNFYGAVSYGAKYGLGDIYRLTLSAPPPVPVVTSATETAQVGVAFRYQIAATNSPTSFGATNLPPGLSVNTATGLISGTPTQSGRFPVGLSATNAGGAGTGTLSLTVNPPPPAITSALTASGRAGHAFTYEITASNTPTSFAATGLPAGLTINRATGMITGTPAATGTTSVVLAAANSGGVGRATLTLTISP